MEIKKFESMAAFKQHQKDLAQAIIDERTKRREALKTKETRRVYGYDYPIWMDHHTKAAQLGWEFRLYHIAYSKLRGKTYEQIEQKCRDNNLPDWRTIEAIIAANKEITRGTDVCSTPARPEAA